MTSIRRAVSSRWPDLKKTESKKRDQHRRVLLYTVMADMTGHT